MSDDGRPNLSTVYWPEADEHDERQLWGVLAAVAVVLAALTWFGLRMWHDSLEPSHEKIMSCANELPNGGYAKCVHVSYPWPAANPLLAAALVALGVLVVARLYVFMRRIEARS
jgi:hypothetical protein